MDGFTGILAKHVAFELRTKRTLKVVDLICNPPIIQQNIIHALMIFKKYLPVKSEDQKSPRF